MHIIEDLKVKAIWRVLDQKHEILDSDPRDMSIPRTWRIVEALTAVNVKANIVYKLKKSQKIKFFEIYPTELITQVNIDNNGELLFEITWKAPTLPFRNSKQANFFLSNLTNSLNKIRLSRITESELSLPESLVALIGTVINSTIGLVAEYKGKLIAYGDVPNEAFFF